MRIGAIIIAVLLVLGGTYELGLHHGGASVEAGWQAREAKANAEAAAKVKAAEDRVLELERRAAVNLVAVDAHYRQTIKEKDDALAAAVAAAGTGGMWVHASCPPSTQNPSSGVTAGPRGSDGAGVARLSDEDARFLLTEAARADAVVAKLTAAQEIIRQDRLICNGGAT